MADVRITCVRKPHPTSPAQDITHLGTGLVVWTTEQVISWIDGGKDTFHTLVEGKRAEIVVVRDGGKAPYLRTRADGRWSDSLLVLPYCA